MLTKSRSFIRNHSYTIVMAVSAVITMAKLVMFANYASPEEFNAYLIPLSLGSFLGFILSFGLVESTTKLFARLFSDKQEIIALGSYRYILPILVRRFFFLTFFISVFTILFQYKTFIWGISISLIALTVSSSTLLASMQRSTLRQNVMGGTNIFRASLSVLAVFFGYSILPINGPIFGEIFAQVISLFMGYLMLIHSHKISFKKIISVPFSNLAKNLNQNFSLKLSLFFAYLIMSIPLYLDRYYFESAYSLDEMAPYSFCAIFLSASYLIFNTLYQRAGPLMIIEYKSGKSSSEIISMALRTSVAGALCLTILFLCVFLTFEFNYAENLFNKYSISNEMLFLIFLISLSNMTAIFEGVFLSFDQEKKFMYCSFIYLGLLILTILVNILFQFSLIQFLSIYFALKLSHLFFIVFMLYDHLKRSTDIREIIT